MNITITGRIPSKKNCKMALQIKGRCMVVNNTKYREWERDVMKQLAPHPHISAKISQIKIVFFAPDRRKSDLTNKAEAIMDALVSADIITDDNWYEIPEVLLKFGGVDDIEPRAEIQIT